eukprot:15154119-Alexandrium_andersonii.AAC.1
MTALPGRASRTTTVVLPHSRGFGSRSWFCTTSWLCVMPWSVIPAQCRVACRDNRPGCVSVGPG